MIAAIVAVLALSVPEPEAESPRLVVPAGDARRVFALSESPDGQRRLFTRDDEAGLSLMEMRRQPDGSWSEARRADFSAPAFSDADPFFAPSEGTLYFMSRRPHPGRVEGRDDFDLWKVGPDGEGWATPEPLPASINTDAQEIFPSIDRHGVLYFASDRLGGLGGLDLYRAVPHASGYRTESLGPSVNTAEGESNPAVLPNGSAVIFYSRGYPSLGDTDLLVSRRLGQTWSAPVNLGPVVNSVDGEFAPGFSGDGATLIFGRVDAIWAVPVATVSELANNP